MHGFRMHETAKKENPVMRSVDSSTEIATFAHFSLAVVVLTNFRPTENPIIKSVIITHEGRFPIYHKINLHFHLQILYNMKANIIRLKGWML